MKFILALVGLMLAVGIASNAHATASAVTQTISFKSLENGQLVKIVKLHVVASSVDGSVADVTVPKLHGYVLKAMTKPGVTAPTDLYDISLVGPEVSEDALNGVLQNRSTSNTEVVYPTGGTYLPLWLQPDDYTLHIANNSVHSAIVDIYLFIVDSKMPRP